MRAILYAAVAVFTLSACVTASEKSSSDAVTASDLPGPAIILGACETEAAGAEMLAMLRGDGPTPGLPCIATSPAQVDTELLCESMRGIFMDWQGDPFVWCDVKGHTSIAFLWFEGMITQPEPSGTAASYVPVHGEFAWVMKHENVNKVSCCHPSDTVYLPHEDANSLQVGDTYTATFPDWGTQTVTINTILPTEDHHGRAVITRYGCLFRHMGF